MYLATDRDTFVGEVLGYWVTVRRMYNVYNRIQTNIEPLQGNCRDPVRCVGSQILTPNHASGITTLGPFRSKPSHPTEL